MSMGLIDFVMDAKSRIQEVDIHAAEQLMHSGDYQVLDVREPAEFLSGTVIEHALHIPRGILEAAADKDYAAAIPALRDGRTQKWLVFCRSGGRGALAADTLQKMGFTHVVNVLGGVDAWSQAGKAMTVPDDAESLVQLKQPCISIS